tara:strand:+ start:1510 stop:2088 length:579 start_codon:yes stop_codon:yes gene_type:complete
MSKSTERDIGAVLRFQSDSLKGWHEVTATWAAKVEGIDWFISNDTRRMLMIVLCDHASRGVGIESIDIRSDVVSDAHIKRMLNEGVNKGFLISYRKPEDKRVMLWKMEDSLLTSCFEMYMDIVIMEFSNWYHFIGSGMTPTVKRRLVRGTLEKVMTNQEEFLSTLLEWDHFGDTFYKTVASMSKKNGKAKKK